VVGQALGQFRKDLLDEVEQMIAEQVNPLRPAIEHKVSQFYANANLKRECADGPTLPNPLGCRYP
jgi:hypothetical protein